MEQYEEDDSYLRSSWSNLLAFKGGVLEANRISTTVTDTIVEMGACHNGLRNWLTPDSVKA